MKYAEVANALYGSDLNDILNIIYHAEEAEHFEQRISSIVIHTGFIYSTSKQEIFVLLYDLRTEKVIRQLNNCEHLPQLNGLLVVKVNAPYFNIPIPLFFSHVKDNNEVHTYHNIDIEGMQPELKSLIVTEKNTAISIDSIKLLSPENLAVTKEYPLRRNFESLVYQEVYHG